MITSDGLFGVDRDQRIVEWSESAERVFGLRAEEVLGRPCYEVLANDESGGAPVCRPNCGVIVNARRRRPTANFDMCVRSRNRPAWFNVSTLVAQAGVDDAPLVRHLARDVTDRRAMTSLLGATGGRARVSEPEVPAECAPALSRRERQVVHLLAGGYRTEEIAEALRLSPITVRNHITRAMSKLGARSRLEAVVRAAELRIV